MLLKLTCPAPEADLEPDFEPVLVTPLPPLPPPAWTPSAAGSVAGATTDGDEVAALAQLGRVRWRRLCSPRAPSVS